MSPGTRKFFDVVDWSKLFWYIFGLYMLMLGTAFETNAPLLPALKSATGAAVVFVGGYLQRREKKDLTDPDDAPDPPDAPDRSPCPAVSVSPPTV